MTQETNSDPRGAELRGVSQSIALVVDALLDRGTNLGEALSFFELRYISAAVKRHKGNTSKAALVLGVHRNTLRAKLQRNGSRPRKE